LSPEARGAILVAVHDDEDAALFADTFRSQVDRFLQNAGSMDERALGVTDRPEDVRVYRRVESFADAADQHRNGFNLAKALHDTGNIRREQGVTRQKERRAHQGVLTKEVQGLAAPDCCAVARQRCRDVCASPTARLGLTAQSARGLARRIERPA